MIMTMMSSNSREWLAAEPRCVYAVLSCCASRASLLNDISTRVETPEGMLRGMRWIRPSIQEGLSLHHHMMDVSRHPEFLGND